MGPPPRGDNTLAKNDRERKIGGFEFIDHVHWEQRGTGFYQILSIWRVVSGPSYREETKNDVWVPRTSPLGFPRVYRKSAASRVLGCLMCIMSEASDIAPCLWHPMGVFIGEGPVSMTGVF